MYFRLGQYVELLIMYNIVILLFLIFHYCYPIPTLDIRYPQFFHIVNNTVEVLEGKTSGSFIAFINLLNDIPTVNNNNEWELTSSDTDFSIQSSTALSGRSWTLITTNILDRERTPFYQFQIEAKHLVKPFYIVNQTVKIKILDINDNLPLFNRSLYQCNVKPTIQYNELIIQVNAYDLDEGKNGEIIYSLINYNDLFRINLTDGRIFFIGKNKLKADTRYDVIVQAQDLGEPPLSSTTLLKVHVSSLPTTLSNSWHVLTGNGNGEQNPKSILIIAGLLAFLFVLCSIIIGSICRCHLKRRKQLLNNNNNNNNNGNTNHTNGGSSGRRLKSTSSSASSSSSSGSITDNDLQQTINVANGEYCHTDDDHFERAVLYDPITSYPNTYVLLKQNDSQIPSSSLTWYAYESNNTNNNNSNNIQNDHDKVQCNNSSNSQLCHDNNRIKLQTLSNIDNNTNHQGSSSTSSPVRSDDGCYCSSDMSSEQSHHSTFALQLDSSQGFLLNPSSLTSTDQQLPRLITSNHNENCRLKTLKHVRFKGDNNGTMINTPMTSGVASIDSTTAMKRFENIYDSSSTSTTIPNTIDSHASYV
ncbi:unnamed protein product [Didymodactylos carnosus]|uniref:Cadherin domain-containing protein n=1 Tax=Didymodactylos carnosus TaxID=1234261 RepID=A0A813SHC1_9BILA|nr:unnamed protein product [Didymodactylos carnosus]CAF0795112.1 unnamed protein product [Didymodactylos carnosus]CAF3521904.1 unnamed protein product [Didymodactylos carnosus]CAF3579623.1 unnamed protein product [Didymodactylos carnosus]